MPKEPCGGDTCINQADLAAIKDGITRAEGALHELRSILRHDVCCMCPNGSRCWPFDKFMAVIDEVAEALSGLQGIIAKVRGERLVPRESGDTEMSTLASAMGILLHYGFDKPKVYVAGPYSSRPEANLGVALNVGDTIVDMGADPYIPHLCHYREQRRSRPYSYWIAEDLRWLRVCNALYRIPGLSRGADMEVAYAGHLGIPVFEDIESLEAWVSGWRFTEVHPQLSATPQPEVDP
jgi:hypothetical protein